MTAAAGQIQKQSGDVMKKTTFLALFLMLAAQSATGAATVQIEGVSFEKSVDIDDTRLQLQGTALLKYMVFIKAYVGALYTATPSTPEEILGPVPKQLVLEYFRLRPAGLCPGTWWASPSTCTSPSSTPMWWGSTSPWRQPSF
jgi:hypothetical protein